MRCSSSISCGRRRCRVGSSSVIRSCGARCTRRAPGGWRLAAHTRAAAELAARGAAAAERAHHVEQSASPGDEEAIDAAVRRRYRGRAACSCRRGPLARVDAPTAPRRPTTSGRSTFVSRSHRRSAPSASSSGVATRCWRRSSCCRRASRERQIELTASCAATEHWLGRSSNRVKLSGVFDDDLCLNIKVLLPHASNNPSYACCCTSFRLIRSRTTGKFSPFG